MAESNGSLRQEGRQEALLALYEATWGEITRLRDYEWRIAYYVVFLDAGLIAVVFNDAAASVLCWEVRLVLTVGLALTAFFAGSQLWKTHGYLTDQRNIRTGLEERLGFHAEDGCPEPLLPREWRGRKIEHGFQRVGLLIPLMAGIAFVTGLTIWAVWTAALGAETTGRIGSAVDNGAAPLADRNAP